MKQYRLIVFDVDGTLVNAYPAIYRSFNFTMRALHAIPQDEAVIHRAVGWGDESLLKPFVKPVELEQAMRIYRRHHAQALKRLTRLYPGVRTTLGYCMKKGYTLAIASNRPSRFVHIILRHLKIARFFKQVLCQDQIAHGKPNPEILKVIMRSRMVSSAQTMYVGDMAIDVQTGKRARVTTVAVTTGSSTRRELARENPDYIIPGLRALTGLTIL